MIKNKTWKITYLVSRGQSRQRKMVADIIAPTRRLAILNFVNEIGFFKVVSAGVRRARKMPNGTVRSATDRPVPYRQYRLTGARGVACIANGNTWAESEDKS